MTTFSVIIPTYNRKDYLRACLESVAQQRLRPNEVIVVDDGSTDGTQQMLGTLTDVTLIQQANAGPGAARNRGAAAANGDYLAFLDSDDIWFPLSLQVMAELIERHGHPSLLFARFEDFSGTTPSEIVESPAVGEVFSDYFASAARGLFAGAGMMVIKRDIFDRAGGFDEARMNAEDHDLAMRLGTAPGFVQVMAPTIIGHRIHDGNEMGNAQLNLTGITRLVTREQAGAYLGGASRARDRRKIICQHVRSAVFDLARAGQFSKFADLYRDTFLWNLREGRMKFLIAAPIVAGVSRLKRSGK